MKKSLVIGCLLSSFTVLSFASQEMLSEYESKRAADQQKRQEFSQKAKEQRALQQQVRQQEKNAVIQQQVDAINKFNNGDYVGNVAKPGINEK